MSYRVFDPEIPSVRYYFPSCSGHKLEKAGAGKLDLKLRLTRPECGRSHIKCLQDAHRFPANDGKIQVRTTIHPADVGRPLRFSWPAMRSPFARVADFLRRKRANPNWLSSASANRSPLDSLTVIGLIAGEPERRALAGICSRNRWNLLFVATREEARTVLDKVKAPVILCDRDLPGNGWRATVEDLASSPQHACIILVSGVVDTYLWNEVVLKGGFDVLPKPLREDEVVRAVRLAWSYWNSATKTTPTPASPQVEES